MALDNSKGGELNRLFSRLSTLDSGDMEVVEEFIRYLKLKQKKAKLAPSIPCEIFEEGVSCFEAVTKFLREEAHLSYKEIAKFLKRSVSTIGVVYKNAKLKSKISYKKLTPKVTIQADIFSSKLTPFESIVIELKDKQGFSLKDIANVTKRNYRTVWTVYKRGLSKIKNVR